ncbi:TPA: hypothetical protein UMY79_002198 [Stenotrophomonas maltophilia]|nr:hypothetical protein [Stenotrophomonas maltophilia]
MTLPVANMPERPSLQMLQEYLSLLRADQVPHSGRTLKDHLEGTGRILREWRCDEAVCIAGMFHSIYGTNVFGFKRLGWSDRPLVGRMLGERAEHLVYLFCVSDRPGAFLEALGTGIIRHRTSGESFSAGVDVCAALLEIESANLIEQGCGEQFLKRLSAWVSAYPDLPLSVGLRSLLAGYAAAGKAPAAPGRPTAEELH